MVALSGQPNDMRLRARRQRQGVPMPAWLSQVFTRSVRKAIGAFAWLMGGLDAVVFTGGIGEHDGKSRAEILRGLESSGVVLDATANEAGGDALRRVSSADSKVDGLGGYRPGRSHDRSARESDWNHKEE